MCIKFNFISICAYLCGVSPMYCSLSNYFGSNEFWDHCVLECVIGTLEIHWMLVTIIRRCGDWMIIGSKLGWSTNSYLLHPTNGISVTSIPLMHTFLASNLCGCIMAWFPSVAFIMVLARFYCIILIVIWVSWDECIFWGVYKIHVYDSPIPHMPI